MKEMKMKRTFMIGVAAGALLASINLASAQGAMEQKQQPAASGGANVEQKAGSGSQQKSGADAQKKSDSGADKARAQSQDNMKGTTGQAQQSKDSGADKARAQSQDNMKGTTGQAQQSKDAQKQDAQKLDASKDKNAQSKPESTKGGAAAQSDTKSGAAASSGQNASGGKVSLNTEQKTKIRETVIRSSNAPRVTNVNFSVTVGTVVPRTVRFAPLPPVLVEINPSWRSYEYFIVNEQIVIIEPGSLRIIAILDV
jgi:hypothetical protein